jgi:hypothetical protein
VALARQTLIERSKGVMHPAFQAEGKPSRAICQTGESRSWLEPRPWGRVVRATPPTDLQPTPGPVIESLTPTELTDTSKKGRTAESAPKVMVGPKQAPITKPRKHAKPGSLCNPTQGNGDLTPIQPITH